MKNDLVITDRKVVNLTAFRETIGLKVVPLFFPCIFFVKIDVKKDALITSLFNNASVVFVNVEVCLWEEGNLPESYSQMLIAYS